MDKCSKHDEVMGRLFDEISDIKVKQEGISIKMDAIIAFKDMIHDIIFGNGKPGLRAEVEKLQSHTGKIWAIILIILTAALTAIGVHTYWRQ